jgi:hypothetical protein
MHMPRALRGLPDLEALQDLSLKRSPVPLGRLYPILLRGDLELREAGDAELPVKLEHLVGTQPRKRQELQHAFRNILSHSLERRMRPRAVKLGDNVGNGLADTGNISQPILGDEAIERLGDRRQILGCPDIGLGPIGISTGESRAAAIFSQKLRYFRRT